jgi:mono/diheme cytochrome c family protein
MLVRQESVMPSRRLKTVVAVLVLTSLTAVAAVAARDLRERQKRSERAMQIVGGEPDKASKAMVRYGCGACHQISGVRMPGGLAAQPLSGFSERRYIGGTIENTPSNLVGWIVNPKAYNARTAMPVTGISESEARDVAAYLYSRE